MSYENYKGVQSKLVFKPSDSSFKLQHHKQQTLVNNCILKDYLK